MRPALTSLFSIEYSRESMDSARKRIFENMRMRSAASAAIQEFAVGKGKAIRLFSIISYVNTGQARQNERHPDDSVRNKR